MALHGSTLFCDDIRQEVAGKFTLVGCYGPELRIHGERPATLPKLGVYCSLFAPLDEVPTELTFRLTYSGSEEPLFESELRLPPEERERVISRATAGVPEDAGEVVSFVQHIVLSPVVIPADGTIKMRAIADGKTIRLGSLKIILVSSGEAGVRETSPELPSTGRRGRR